MYSDECDSKHLFCNFCVHTVEVHCPEGKLHFGENDLTEDTKINEIIQTLTVYCIHKHEGCDHHGDLKDLKGHLQNGCAYHLIQCNSCNTKIKSRDMAEHTDYCMRKYTSYEHCGDAMPEGNQKKHFEICSSESAICPFCHECKTKTEITDHMETCIKRLPDENSILENEKHFETCPGESAICPFCQEYKTKTEITDHMEICLKRLPDENSIIPENEKEENVKKHKLSEAENFQDAVGGWRNEDNDVNLVERITALKTENQDLRSILEACTKTQEKEDVKNTIGELDYRIKPQCEDLTKLLGKLEKSEQDNQVIKKYLKKEKEEKEHATALLQGRELELGVLKKENTVLQTRLTESEREKRDLQKRLDEEIRAVQTLADNKNTIEKLKEKAESLNEEVIELKEKLRDRHFKEKRKDERRDEVPYNDFYAEKEGSENNTRSEDNELMDKLLVHITDPEIKTETRSEIVRILRSAKQKQNSQLANLGI